MNDSTTKKPTNLGRRHTLLSLQGLLRTREPAVLPNSAAVVQASQQQQHLQHQLHQKHQHGQRPRAYSMLPLTTSVSNEDMTRERAPLLPLMRAQSRGGPRSSAYRQRCYPLSQEETLELLYLLNQGQPESQSN